MRLDPPGRLAAAVLAALVLALAACTENPATGKRQLALISEEQEIELGRETSRQVEASLGLVDDAELQEYVQSIGTRLAAGSERPELPWTFKVVDDPTPNAFALPGGWIYVTRGLLTLMNSEAELASVLGHEIAHVTARHSVQMVQRATIVERGLNLGVRLFPNLESLAGVAATGLQLVFLKHGRDAERQADELGFRYAFQNNYDVAEMADVFVSLQRASGASSHGTSALPGWLATHPSEPERIRAVEQRIARLQQRQRDPRIAREEYLAQLDGLVIGEDPRHGFFRGRTFLHPDLAFRFDVPEGWRTENLTSAVIATSERQDAQFQLTLAPNLAPTDAAAAFLRQPNLRGALQPAAINGLPAAIGRFEARTPGGPLVGIAAFVRHRDTTYQLVGLSSPESADLHAAAFERAISSFATLTDPAALRARPERIRIVRVPRTMTLTEFARAQGARVPVARLALINGVLNTDARIPAGTPLKTIVGGVR